MKTPDAIISFHSPANKLQYFRSSSNVWSQRCNTNIQIERLILKDIWFSWSKHQRWSVDLVQCCTSLSSFQGCTQSSLYQLSIDQITRIIFTILSQLVSFSNVNNAKEIEKIRVSNNLGIDPPIGSSFGTRRKGLKFQFFHLLTIA